MILCNINIRIVLGNFFCNLSFQNPVSCISSTTAETKNYYWLKVNCLLAVVLHLWDSWAYHKNKALKCLFSFPSYFPISNNKMKRFFTLFFKQKNFTFWWILGKHKSTKIFKNSLPAISYDSLNDILRSWIPQNLPFNSISGDNISCTNP